MQELVTSLELYRTGKPISLARINELLNATSTKNATDLKSGYMILNDGSKAPLNTQLVGSFKGRAGEPRKLFPPDQDVIAYVARP